MMARRLSPMERKRRRQTCSAVGILAGTVVGAAMAGALFFTAPLHVDPFDITFAGLSLCVLSIAAGALTGAIIGGADRG